MMLPCSGKWRLPSAEMYRSVVGVCQYKGHRIVYQFDSGRWPVAGSASTLTGASVAGGEDLPAGLNWDLLPREAAPGEDEAGLAGRIPAVDEQLWAVAAEQGWDLPVDGAAGAAGGMADRRGGAAAWRGAPGGLGAVAGVAGVPGWVLEVPAEVLFGYLERCDRAGPAEALPGLLPRDLGRDAGFGAGGVGDRLPPGATLAGLAGDVWAAGLARLGDDELAGIVLAWRRLASWATAGELAAVAELDRRRTAQVAAGADPQLAGHVGDELAALLTLTARSAAALLDFAAGLARLPRTRAALAAGEIDRARTRVIVTELAGLRGPAAAKVEAAVIGRAGRQTTGQLRAAAQRAVLAADPAAARTRREAAAKDARVEVWAEPAGTAALAGRDLPAADVLAAGKRIDALARQLKAAGRDGGLDQLRARVYTALLPGQPPETLLPAPPGHGNPPAGQPGRAGSVAPPALGGPGVLGTGAGRPGGAAADAAGDGSGLAGLPGLGGSVNLTMPLATWLGASQAPGEAAGFGPLPAEDARALAGLVAARPGSRWCLTFTDSAGRAIAHGCAFSRPTTGTPRAQAPGSSASDDAASP